jgi:splicing factor 3B subunit 4
MVKLYGKPIRVNKASQDKNSQDVGANLFIGNLDADVDEKVGHGCFYCMSNTGNSRQE